MWVINQANIKDWAKNYKGPLFDGILCDPPYELGFMGKSWDSSGIAFDTEMWADIYKLLKPGGHLLAFSGSRTYHRMAVAIEDAGFEIRDMIEWVYGSGFPKSLNIGKAVDKANGIKIEATGNGERETTNAMGNGLKNRCNVCDKPFFSGNPCKCDRTYKSSNDYQGYGTALKPAHEPCVLARKPIEGTVANNVLKHGTGGLNIDGSRVETTDTYKQQAHDIRNNALMGKKGRHPTLFVESNPLGRFPANLIHDGSDEVVGLFPYTKSGSLTGSTRTRGNTYSKPSKEPQYSNGDSGSAARFFYTAKASKSERNAGLEGFEEVVKPLMGEFKNNPGRETPKSSPTARANHHPTVKPLSLTKYLANLIKPPQGGRLLVPFSGSGSEMIGALQAGWEYVEGVELTEEYIPIAEARIKHWTKEPEQKSLL
jgi:DNA modification methylase